MIGTTRRRFLSLTAASVACETARMAWGQRVPDQAIEARLEIGAEKGPTMPLAFLGLSYEAAQLADPSFFSASNIGLVNEFRSLTSSGSLRLGGTLSDLAQWWDPSVQPKRPALSPAVVKGESRFEWTLTTPSVARDRYAFITPHSIKELRGFLDATGWSAIYGLNLGTGTAEQAGAEGACVADTLGEKLTALQVGNESDLFKYRLRPRSWDFPDYWSQYQQFVKAVHERSPGAPFAGPDTAGFGWLLPYANKAGRHPQFLSSHYYAMGPAGAPGVTAQKLLSQHASLAALIEAARHAMSVHDLPYRITEANSCWHGGMPGASDAYASALWVIDFMLQAAQGGVSGVNLHGGGLHGIYSPIVGDSSTGYAARPITKGMRLANEFAGATFLSSKFRTNGVQAVAYAARKQDELLIAIVNKDARPIRCVLNGDAGMNPKRATLLTAPTLGSKTGIELRDISVKKNLVVLPSYTAILIRDLSLRGSLTKASE